MTQSQEPRRSAFRSIRQNPCTSHRTSRFSGLPPNRYSPWILRLDGSGREIISRILRGRTQPSTRSCFVDTREDANPPKIRTNMTSLRGRLAGCIPALGLGWRKQCLRHGALPDRCTRTKRGRAGTATITSHHPLQEARTRCHPSPQSGTTAAGMRL